MNISWILNAFWTIYIWECAINTKKNIMHKWTDLVSNLRTKRKPTGEQNVWIMILQKMILCVSSYKSCCRWSCCSLMLVIPCTNIEEKIKVSNISACICFYKSALLQLKINTCAYRIKVSVRFKNPVEYPVGNMLIPVINQSK